MINFQIGNIIQSIIYYGDFTSPKALQNFWESNARYNYIFSWGLGSEAEFEGGKGAVALPPISCFDAKVPKKIKN